jgi:4-alpha-glucanotransferase
MTTPSRSTGVLLHPTALPGSPVCGSFGEPCRRWINLLADNNIGVWQLLPLAPPDGTGSPYNSPSCFALNPWFLDAEELRRDGFITDEDIQNIPGSEEPTQGVGDLSIEMVKRRSDGITDALLNGWTKQSKERHQQFENWCRQQPWLENHALFTVLHDVYQKAWWDWPEKLARHHNKALRHWSERHKDKLLRIKLQQWQLNQQWATIRELAKSKEILIFGDLPFYVSADSVDVWSNRNLFTVKENGELTTQSGVPPDYFSETGQLWGSPVYRWRQHRLTRFQWWRQRFARQRELADLLRLDHFRALAAYWAVPGKDKTAENGQWKPSPGRSLLNKLKQDGKGVLPLIAEDLGVITPDVEALRNDYQLAGMKVLQFAFDGMNDNPYLPENIIGQHWVVYTGTHDNPTTLGWWKNLDDTSRNRVAARVNGEVNAPAWHLFDIAFATTAKLVIAPLQDLLHLDNESRFNTPGTCEGNWTWRQKSFDDILEGAMKGYGERGLIWGRSKQGATEIARKGKEK